VRRFLLGAKVILVRRRAKVLIIDLSSNYSLVCHLKMTGQIIVIHDKERWGAGHPSDSFVRELPDNTTRQHLEFADGTYMYFNDLRKFGWMKLYPTAEVPNIEFMKKVGPEPLEDSFTGDVLYERLQRRKNTSIKAAILDQTVLAGVGNIYADESLWAVKLHPSTLVKNISKSKIKDLAKAIKAVLTLSIEKGGSTDKNYVNAEGKKGSYLEFANVFRREGQPCPRCGTTITKIRVAGRGTHVCAACQKL
jgi:formamidopyrimidine-DNA glycosylase